ncbi:MAG: ribose-phosphate diphosphokinase [Burkholderiales bacterium]|nr:ribose-phosphate diphosphokinase [Burkholderiales bacterium]
MTAVVFALPGNAALATALADRLQLELGAINLRSFPDGETYLRFDTPVAGRPVLLACSLHDPDHKVMSLLFAAATARELGATTVGLVAPYLGYMRQDRRFLDGEAVTSALFAKLLSRHLDWLVTIDPHLHRWQSLDEIYSVPSAVVAAAPLLAAWIRLHVEAPVLIGPDAESEQWVAAVASFAGAPHLVLEKVRHGDRNVTVSIPDPELLRNRTPVLVDDIISTARTMIAAVQQVSGLGPRPPVCVGVHAIFAGDAHAALLAAGAMQIVTTNTIPHPSNQIDINDAIADTLRGFL